MHIYINLGICLLINDNIGRGSLNLTNWIKFKKY